MIRRRLAERRSARGRWRHSSNPADAADDSVDSPAPGDMDLEEEDEEEEPKKKPMPWREQTSSDVYEEQLEKLQDQLIATMIEKQTLEGQLSASWICPPPPPPLLS